MRCTTPSVLSLSLVLTTAATAAVTSAPRNDAVDYGSWDFSGSAMFPVSGYTSYRVDATYRNAELAAPVAVACSYLYNPRDRAETASCSDPSFSYDFGGVRQAQANTVATVTLRQTVALSGANVTVTGARHFSFDFSGGAGFTGTAAGVIDAKTATA
ncbi:hypothetical protein CH63R_05207 [Colletotrichum higginsianum IMI 349063]|uniref:Uncharacterized protein n=2 Tax=Colletotrichum higginsianum TaxID=80884 RepID=A0A1B7YLK6_COLHI|nr:hypothetical protein CH63R_05207 [Colletotrichum higginsianum IMI 349063]OBR12911.1 hypothetical protein CH63R_05207 [Colletotrichum higginsianum IMI 349063]TIC99670.1 hypothetical protein CH35J_005021 [Colletotrichum higginsianum]GJC94583.1 hypothetical protein ColKHC_03409 [Colletotrichum higginsianum]